MKIWLGLLLTVVPMFGADVTGKWAVDGKIGDFPIQPVCALTQKDAALTGACSLQGADFPLTGSVNGKDLTWQYEVDYQGMHLTVVYKATLDTDDSMKGTVSVMDGSGAFTAKRQ
ncbi:MAG: hypothetical protein ACRD30_09140 [Bryobacteraceae bacterium]